jgi:hypothetical protein
MWWKTGDLARMNLADQNMHYRGCSVVRIGEHVPITLILTALKQKNKKNKKKERKLTEEGLEISNSFH